MTTEETGPSGFWSYVHKDNDRVNGRILRLAQKIRDEFALISGQELEIFVDRESLVWGDQWALKINSVLEETTFFIPIVTPAYFRSEACRRELLKFATFARSLNAEELLLPILFVDVPGLSVESDDEAMRLVAETQYADWRELRLTDEESEHHARAVNELAQRLADIAQEYANRPSALASAAGSGGGASADAAGGDEEPGLQDRLADLETAIPEWAEIMESFGPTLESIGQVMQASAGRMSEAKTFAQRVLIARETAEQLSGLADEFLSKSNAYASKLVSFDPGVRAFFELVAVEDEERSEEDEREVAEASAALREMITASKTNSVAIQEFIGVLREPSKMFKDLRPVLGKLEQGSRGMLDAHTVLDEWLRLMGPESPPEAGSLT